MRVHGDSFRDLTRIARINDKMWAELFLWNKQNLIAEIDQFDAALARLRAALEQGDREQLEQMFRLSTQRRAAFDKKNGPLTAPRPLMFPHRKEVIPC